MRVTFFSDAIDFWSFVGYIISMTAKEEKEFNEAFDNFERSIDNAINAIQDFVQMDINKTSEPTLETQREEEATSETFFYW